MNATTTNTAKANTAVEIFIERQGTRCEQRQNKAVIYFANGQKNTVKLDTYVIAPADAVIAHDCGAGKTGIYVVSEGARIEDRYERRIATGCELFEWVDTVETGHAVKRAFAAIAEDAKADEPVVVQAKTENPDDYAIPTRTPLSEYTDDELIAELERRGFEFRDE